jgi:putative membrane protein
LAATGVITPEVEEWAARRLHFFPAMTGASQLARGALIGLVGGLVAAGAMSLAHRVASDIAPKAEAPPASKKKDSTVKVASAVTKQVGYELTENQEPWAASIVHYAFGGSVGALYGAVAAIVPRVTSFVGLPFGLAVWLGAHVLTVPALGLEEPPTRRPFRQEAEEFALHGVYGVTTELVRRLLLLLRPA